MPIFISPAFASPVDAQEPPYAGPDAAFEQAPFSELTNLVAPVALYPDPLLSQILVACTYSPELVEAQQWLDQYGYLQGTQLIQAAQQQNWDPSVQALVAFPGVLALLNSNIRWTTALGRTFLAEPADVMNAIQWLRAQAREKGQLANTPQFSIEDQAENGQSAIEIEPANPQAMYVPAYDPAAVWGPPAAGAYPELPYEGNSFGSILGTAIDLASMFSGFTGLLGPNSWGWALGWLAQTLYINNSFFSNFGFRGVSGGLGGSSLWVHNTTHIGAPFAPVGNGWRGFGDRGRTPDGPSRMPLGRPGRGGNFGNWASGRGNWRSFGNNARSPFSQPAGHFTQSYWTGRNGLQPPDRFRTGAYRPGAGAYHNSFTGGRFRPPASSGFSSFRDRGSRSPHFGQSGFARPRMISGHTLLPRGHSSGSWKPSKQHFRAPHFSALHFRSHGSGHFSHGHRGGRHHR